MSLLLKPKITPNFEFSINPKSSSSLISWYSWSGLLMSFSLSLLFLLAGPSTMQLLIEGESFCSHTTSDQLSENKERWKGLNLHFLDRI